ncbi:rRNA-processing protein EFG1-like [Dendronephthya gigantea]|uniref:rRNA-processing protein EFG1-like n=1 Tax=Dendronephthya gigantea TaxID=151771 RepID=UPI00106B9A39|nr:rRNA-processing protein EFG1-like [Dendronephthya gigantea]
MAPQRDKRVMVKKKSSKSIKQRIRSIKRLLNKPDIAADVRVSQERMLKFMQSKLEEQQQYKNESQTKMIKKYKMVKFFEKRKLWRQHRSVVKELRDSPNSQRTEELQRILNKILRDINYVQYFPSDRKYVSLFPAQPYINQTVIEEQEQLHRCINEKVDSGQLPQANFSQCSSDSKDKTKVKNIKRIMDKHSKEDLKISTCNFQEDDFFTDTSNRQTNSH